MKICRRTAHIKVPLGSMPWEALLRKNKLALVALKGEVGNFEKSYCGLYNPTARNHGMPESFRSFARTSVINVDASLATWPSVIKSSETSGEEIHVPK